MESYKRTNPKDYEAYKSQAKTDAVKAKSYYENLRNSKESLIQAEKSPKAIYVKPLPIMEVSQDFIDKSRRWSEMYKTNKAYWDNIKTIRANDGFTYTTAETNQAIIQSSNDQKIMNTLQGTEINDDPLLRQLVLASPNVQTANQVIVEITNHQKQGLTSQAIVKILDPTHKIIPLAETKNKNHKEIMATLELIKQNTNNIPDIISKTRENLKMLKSLYGNVKLSITEQNEHNTRIKDLQTKHTNLLDEYNNISKELGSKIESNQRTLASHLQNIENNFSNVPPVTQPINEQATERLQQLEVAMTKVLGEVSLEVQDLSRRIHAQQEQKEQEQEEAEKPGGSSSKSPPLYRPSEETKVDTVLVDRYLRDASTVDRPNHYIVWLDKSDDKYTFNNTIFRVHYLKEHGQIRLKRKIYPTTKGLLNLLFELDPADFSRDDANTYLEILSVFGIQSPRTSTNKLKAVMTLVKQGSGISIPNTVNPTMHHLFIILGEIKAGNRSNELNRQAKEIMDHLLKTRKMSKEDYQRYLKNIHH